MTSWDSPEKVAEYVGRIGTVPQRLAGEAALVEFLPPAPRRALDLGCGHGRLVQLLLDARPDLEEIVAVDVSPPMLARAEESFAGEARVSLRQWDLSESITALGDYDVIVSGFAIHHLADARKRALFGEVAGMLVPGGTFANLEVVASPTPELHDAFTRAIGRPGGDPEDQLADVQSQLTWMRAAGLEQVDCMWKWRGFALMVGTRPISLVADCESVTDERNRSR
jgi:cyclopropane fatty-acyl-phospholipid synthase-like methyltransferase